MSSTISVQTTDFDSHKEYQALRHIQGVGAVVTFVGLVRDFNGGSNQDFYLEHYPGMTENVLAELVKQAQQRWSILAVQVIHRVGHLLPGDQIVYLGVASQHRKDAFAACEFLIDQLKTQAPFWKKEGNHWVEAKTTDQQHADAWHRHD